MFVNINAEKTIFKKKPSRVESSSHIDYFWTTCCLPSNPPLMCKFLTKYNQKFKTSGGMDKVTDVCGTGASSHPGLGRNQGAPRLLHPTAHRGTPASKGRAMSDANGAGEMDSDTDAPSYRQLSKWHTDCGFRALHIRRSGRAQTSSSL